MTLTGGSVAGDGDTVPGGSGGSDSWVFVYHPVSGDPVEQHVLHDGPAGGGDSEVARDPGGWSQDRVDAEFFAIVTDLAGAPLELIDPESGSVAGSQSPTIWGRGSWRGVWSPLAFAGQQVDSETGLHYNRFRYYDPVTASYTSPDPLGIAPNPSAANAYVHNPHTWIDPLGLACPPPKNGDEGTSAGDPSNPLQQRADELQQSMPEGSRGRVTMGVGQGTDAAGNSRTVIGTSEPNGYMRPGVADAIRPGDEVAKGAGHAETSILNHMAEQGIRPNQIAAGRPVCLNCESAIRDAGAITPTKLRGY